MSGSDSPPSRHVTLRRRRPPSLADMILHRPTPTRSPFSVPMRQVENCSVETGSDSNFNRVCATPCGSERDSSLTPCRSSSGRINDTDWPLCLRQENLEDSFGDAEDAYFTQTGTLSAQACVTSISNAKQGHCSLYRLKCCSVTGSNTGIREEPSSSGTSYYEHVDSNNHLSSEHDGRREAFVHQPHS